LLNPPLVVSAWEGRPCAEKLSPGERIKAMLTLPIPVLECGKFRGPDPNAPHERCSVDRIRVVVSYLPKGGKVEVHRYPETDLYDVSGQRPVVLQAELALPELVVALRRTDDFHRPLEDPVMRAKLLGSGG
jgi:hypothetical protein